jgi:hypothetical protein
MIFTATNETVLVQIQVFQNQMLEVSRTLGFGLQVTGFQGHQEINSRKARLQSENYGETACFLHPTFTLATLPV